MSLNDIKYKFFKCNNFLPFAGCAFFGLLLNSISWILCCDLGAPTETLKGQSLGSVLSDRLRREGSVEHLHRPLDQKTQYMTDSTTL